MKRFNIPLSRKEKKMVDEVNAGGECTYDKELKFAPWAKTCPYCEIARLTVQLEIANDKADHLYQDLVGLNKEYDELKEANSVLKNTVLKINDEWAKDGGRVKELEGVVEKGTGELIVFAETITTLTRERNSAFSFRDAAIKAQDLAERENAELRGMIERAIEFYNE